MYFKVLIFCHTATDRDQRLPWEARVWPLGTSCWSAPGFSPGHCYVPTKLSNLKVLGTASPRGAVLLLSGVRSRYQISGGFSHLISFIREHTELETSVSAGDGDRDWSCGRCCVITANFGRRALEILILVLFYVCTSFKLLAWFFAFILN